MKKKELNEAQAWREIAMRIEKRNWRRSGLCREVDTLEDKNVISYNTACDMRLRIKAHMDLPGGREAQWFTGFYFDNSEWAFPRGKSAPRIIAANLLALEAADEARAAR